MREEFKLRFTYYLKLQDRIGEALQLFSSLDKSQFQTLNDHHACKIATDYMEAYLEFLKVNGDDFKRARQILQKYEE